MTTQIMGVLNVTPDSFSDGGQWLDPKQAVARGLTMIAEGADIVDVGGESTRPGAEAVLVDVELQRVREVLKQLSVAGVTLSIDTSKAQVARVALSLGASLINDVTAMDDPDMARVCAEAGCKVCLMHMQGNPRTMQQNPTYGDVVSEVLDYLLRKARRAIAMGVERESILIDPGIGFGKTVEHNLKLLQKLERFVQTGYPVVLGVSRKGFIGKVLGAESPAPVPDRLEGALAIHAWAQSQGVAILRTHDVAPATRVRNMIAAVLEA